MILAILLLLSGLSISVVAIYYSVMGLMAIFSAAAIPIAIMGVSLEIGKLVTASWVKAHWHRLPLLMRTYAIAAVAILMVITSLGIFGYLSKAHSDQTLVSGDVQAKVAIYDERIKTEKDNIGADRKQIAQMDAAVDQILSRSDDEKGASKANEIRRSQLRDRSRLQNEILESQKKIVAIQDERAPFAAENRKVEAEVGPIKYIAAFVYGANPDANILERAVTWVIILIVIVFDPLAVVMLLASQMTFAWIREEKNQLADKATPAEDIKESPVPELTPEQTALYGETFPMPAPPTPESAPCPKCNTPMLYASGIGTFCPNRDCDIFDAPDLYQEPVEVVDEKPIDAVNPVSKDTRILELQAQLDAAERDKEELAEFVRQTHEDYDHVLLTKNELEQQIVQLKLELEQSQEPIVISPTESVAISVVDADPAIEQQAPESYITDPIVKILNRQPNVGFGIAFPDSPDRGDMFLRVDFKPSRLFKWNDTQWIETNKNSTDAYSYNDAYIRFLVSKLGTGEYTLDDLTDTERIQIQTLGGING